MKPYKDCPKCHRPLLNEYTYHRNSVVECKKTCINTDHYLSFVENNDIIKYFALTLEFKRQISINWDFIYQHTFVYDASRASQLQIPFFEPDLKDYNKLIKKCKTYLTFS